MVAVLMVQYLQRLRSLAELNQESIRRAWFLADAIPQMVFVTDAEGRAEYTNRRSSEYTGLTPEDMARAGFASMIHPEEKERVTSEWKRALRRGQPVEQELRVRRASDGSYRWHLWRAVPVRDASGGSSHWFGTLTDIEDQKRAAATLRFLSEASLMLGATVDYPRTLEALTRLAVPRLGDVCIVHVVDWTGVAHPVAVACVDPSVDALRERLARFPLPPLPSNPVFHSIRRQEAVLWPDVSDELLQHMAQGPEHLELLRSAGIRSAMFLPLMHRGRYQGLLSLLSVSERRFGQADLEVARELADRAAQAVANAHLYQELKDAVRQRDDFVSVAGHELKTPLTTLHLQMSMLHRGLSSAGPGQPLDRAQVLSRVELISRQVVRLKKLVDELLDVGRLTSKKVMLETEPLDLAAVVDEVVARMKPELDRAGCAVRVSGTRPLLGRWDRLKVERILTNLVGNAIKFGAGRPVEVLLAAAEDRALIRVTDQGIGIAPADQTRIFDRFERGVSQRKYGGMGLGLWIVRQLAEAMGGSVRVESAPGKGATFTVDLLRGPPERVREPAPLH